MNKGTKERPDSEDLEERTESRYYIQWLEAR